MLPRTARCNPLILALSLLVIALFPAPAKAHTRSHSYSSWVLSGAEARVTARLPGVELTRLGLGLSGRLADSEIPLLGAYLSERLELVSTSGSCEISESARRTRAAPGWVAVTWALRCPPEGTLTLRDSPWDPIKELLPIESDVSARLWTPNSFDRDIALAGKLDADAYAPFADTISGSRWPGENGGPRKR